MECNWFEDIGRGIKGYAELYGHNKPLDHDVMLYHIAEHMVPSDPVMRVTVAHHGAWNGADVYEVAWHSVVYRGHVWMSCGSLRDAYKAVVLQGRV